MYLQLVSLVIDFGFEDNEFLFEAVAIGAEEVVISEVLLERAVVYVILLLPTSVSPVTNVTSFMFVSAMRVQLVVTVEPLSAKSTLRMTPETTLISCAWIIIAELLMFAQFLYREELMLMSEDLFVPRTHITHHLMMQTLHMAMKVRPSIASDITILVWTIIAK